MSFLLDKKREHEARCETLIRGGRPREAVFHAAKAAEFALALASQTDGAIAQRYADEADGWLEIAARLKAAPPRTAPAGAPPGTAREPAAAPGDAPAAETFAMIAGMEDAKRTIREMVIYPLQALEKAKALGLKAGGGVLLYGPPGNGKTTLGKAIAHELDAPFYYASGAQIRSKWHGESEQKLRLLVKAAREHPLAVLFFDDVDGLLPRRGGNSVVDNRIVVQFLAEVGGFEDSANVLLLLGATNKPWEIDEAVFRTGRFDEKIFIPPPDRAARLGILSSSLKDAPREPEIGLEAWADRLEGYTGSDIVGIVNAAKRAALGRCVKDDSAPVVREQDLQAALRNIPASITPGLMKQYERFREQRFG